MASSLLCLRRPTSALLRSTVRSIGCSSSDRKNFVSRILDRYEGPAEMSQPPSEAVYELQCKYG